METLLIHKDLVRTPFFESLIDLLHLEKVSIMTFPLVYYLLSR